MVSDGADHGRATRNEEYHGMKKYLVIAGILGLFTASCVSYLAQASSGSSNDGDGVSAERAAMPQVSLPPDNSADASPADKVEEDRAACSEKADAIPGKSGDGATDEEIAAAFKACMKAKKYTDAQLQEQENEGEGTSGEEEDVGNGSPE